MARLSSTIKREIPRKKITEKGGLTVLSNRYTHTNKCWERKVYKMWVSRKMLMKDWIVARRQGRAQNKASSSSSYSEDGSVADVSPPAPPVFVSCKFESMSTPWPDEVDVFE